MGCNPILLILNCPNNHYPLNCLLNKDPDPQALIEAYLFLDDPVGIDYLLLVFIKDGF